MSNLYSQNFIDRNQHSPTEQAVLDVLKKFGCVTLEQLRVLVPPYRANLGDKYLLNVCRHIHKEKRGQLTNAEKVLIPYKAADADENVLMSIWVYLNLLKEDEMPYISYKNCPVSTYPCSLSFLRDNSILYGIIPISSGSDVAKIMVENERYANYNKDLGLKREYIIAVRDIDLVNEFAKIKPDFPYKVAHVSGDLSGQVEVKFYSVDQ